MEMKAKVGEKKRIETSVTCDQSCRPEQMFVEVLESSWSQSRDKKVGLGGVSSRERRREKMEQARLFLARV